MAIQPEYGKMSNEWKERNEEKAIKGKKSTDLKTTIFVKVVILESSESFYFFG
jgi:hypothetical protein